MRPCTGTYMAYGPRPQAQASTGIGSLVQARRRAGIGIGTSDPSLSQPSPLCGGLLRGVAWSAVTSTFFVSTYRTYVRVSRVLLIRNLLRHSREKCSRRRHDDASEMDSGCRRRPCTVFSEI